MTSAVRIPAVAGKFYPRRPEELRRAVQEYTSTEEPGRIAALKAGIADSVRANRTGGESFRNYVMRHKVETFRALTADLAKPAETFPELYQDWGDDQAFSLQLGRGECAS